MLDQLFPAVRFDRRKIDICGSCKHAYRLSLTSSVNVTLGTIFPRKQLGPSFRLVGLS
ncbi:hypothetical protein VFPBJ_05088 [Purpureocillium lilacinum]|uniref:Uncharacterized protein n=1 Tax=Purpureocillium lilacinum TaxID=33203 RepID=A0A179GYY6_PURLI|nr:hypothetical protein VFPBJ_05088 [Purpureocillium lilacinum]